MRRKWPFRWIVRILLGFVVVAIMAALFILAWDMVPDDADIEAQFGQSDDHLNIDTLHFSGAPRRYIRLERMESKQDLIIFVHGAPGGCTAFGGLLKDTSLSNKFDRIAYDRPGYGPYDREYPMPDIRFQSAMLERLVRTNLGAGRKAWLVSHSFGGPIASLACIALDSLVAGHIMISPVLSPHSERIFWYAGIPVTIPFKWFSSSSWKTAAMEKMVHRKATYSLVDQWIRVATPTLVIHGTRDRLAPVENVAFCRAHFDPDILTVVTWEDASHFIPWTRKDDIADQIMKFIERVDSAETH